MSTGQLIKAARKAAGMTQEDLGEKLGISGSAIAQYETDNRKPKHDTLQRIAAALGIPIYDLLDDKEREMYFEAEVNAEKASVESGYKFTTDEKLLVRLFHTLNDDGQGKAIERVGELTEIPRYQRSGDKL